MLEEQCRGISEKNICFLETVQRIVQNENGGAKEAADHLQTF